MVWKLKLQVKLKEKDLKAKIYRNLWKILIMVGKVGKIWENMQIKTVGSKKRM